MVINCENTVSYKMLLLKISHCFTVNEIWPFKYILSISESFCFNVNKVVVIAWKSFVYKVWNNFEWENFFH